MEQKFLIDTNAVIDYLNSAFSDQGMQFMHRVINSAPAISIITKIELLGFSSGNTEDDALLENFVQNVHIFQLEHNVVQKTINLRKLSKIKLPDAIIAATCLKNGLALITRNTDDFKNIPELELINPHTIDKDGDTDKISPTDFVA